MKLKRLFSGAFAAGLVATAALACGCSGSVASSSARAPNVASVDPNVSGTTSLMSAQIPGPAPRVGKAHLAADDEALAPVEVSDDGAPKEARRSDGSRRGGDFGSSPK